MKRDSFRAGWLAQIFFFLAAASLAAGFKPWSSPIDFDLVAVGIALVIAAPLLWIGLLLAERDQRQGVEDLNAIARWSFERAVAAARRGEKLPVMLYLRPFALTDQLRFRQAGYILDMFTPQGLEKDRVRDLETMIAEQMENTSPLIALGEPGEHVGAGRVFSAEAEWQEAVRKLARASGRILVLPSDQAGTKWEIGWLKENEMFAKCIFLMPPQPDASDIDLAQRWEGARSALRGQGIELPDYEAQGKFFTLDADGRTAREQTFALLSGGSMASAISELVEPPAGWAAANAKPGSRAGLPRRIKPSSVPYFLLFGIMVAAAYVFGGGSEGGRVGVREEFGPFITVPDSWFKKELPGGGIVMQDRDRKFVFGLNYRATLPKISTEEFFEGFGHAEVEAAILEGVRGLDAFAAPGAVCRRLDHREEGEIAFVDAEAVVPSLGGTYRVRFKVLRRDSEQVVLIGLLRSGGGADFSLLQQVAGSLEVRWQGDPPLGPRE